MTRILIQRTVSTLAVAVPALACAVGTSQAKPVKYRCTADRNIVSHYLHVTVDDEKVSEFSYTAGTPAEESINSCSVDSNVATVSDTAPGVQSFSTSAGEILVTRKGKKFVFDFSKLKVTDLCGQSSTIAKHIAITPGSHRCSDVVNVE
ncbi:hypothetical protein AB4Y43_14905 [Paraburkholderia sp. BR10872]|uniref:hypothetical protein n=1 Tax=Paraburkholderia sp. BR10872 TaxID=3236989 RepID=UPI0034D162EF